MRSLYIIGIVTLYMTVNSDADQGVSHHKNTRVSKDDPERSLRFVADLARNFSSFYFQKVTAFVPHDQIASPLGIFFTLSMLSYGAEGHTKNKLLNAIGLPKDKIHMAQTGYKSYFDKLAEHGVQIKTRIFTPPGVKLNPRFVTLSKNVFHSQNESVKATDGFLDSQRINEWVAAQTKDNVTELFKPQLIGPNPSILLASTIYFDGTWEIPFDRSRTELSPFHTLYGESIELETMHTKGRFCVSRIEELKASILKLNYKSRAMSMFVVLPDEAERNEWVYCVHGLRTIKLSRFYNCTEREVEVSMPKFKIQTTMSINNALKERSRLGKAAMKVVIDVNEGGQVAAGSNGVSYKKVNSAPLDRKARSAMPEPPLRFRVDHPFFALVMTDGIFQTDVFSLYFGGENYRSKKRRSHHHNKKLQHGINAESLGINAQSASP